MLTLTSGRVFCQLSMMDSLRTLLIIFSNKKHKPLLDLEVWFGLNLGNMQV